MKRFAMTVAAVLAGTALAAAQQPGGGDKGGQGQGARAQAGQSGPGANAGGQRGPGARQQAGGRGEGRPQRAQADRGGRGDGRSDGEARRGPKQSGNNERGDKRRAQRGEDGKSRQKERAERRGEKRERQAEKSTEKRENRSERREKNRERQAERNKEKRENRAERREDKRERQAERREDKREGRVDRREEKRERQADRRGERDQRDRDRADRSKPVKWNDEQRRRVRRDFREARKGKRHHRNVGFEISFGRSLPRDWDYYSVPSFIVDLTPRYRDYRYAWVDDRYVIVDPNSYEVVAYIDADSGRVYDSSYRSASACSDIVLTRAERRRLRGRLDRGVTVSIGSIDIGFDLPSRYELRRFPDPVLSDYRSLSDCRYIYLENGQVAVVAPESRRVVAVIAE